MLCPNNRKSFHFSSSSSINIINFVLQTFTHPLLALQAKDEKIDGVLVFGCTGHPLWNAPLQQTHFFFFLNRTTYSISKPVCLATSWPLFLVTGLFWPFSLKLTWPDYNSYRQWTSGHRVSALRSRSRSTHAADARRLRRFLFAPFDVDDGKVQPAVSKNWKHLWGSARGS